MKLLVSFCWDRRDGSVEGLLITTKQELESLYGEEVQFGEILGKHSDVYGNVDEEDFEILSEDQDFIKTLEAVIRGPSISGYNPFDYLYED